MRKLLPEFFYKLVFESEAGLRGLGRSKGVGKVSVRTVSWQGIGLLDSLRCLLKMETSLSSGPDLPIGKDLPLSSVRCWGERARQGGLAERAQQRPGPG